MNPWQELFDALSDHGAILLESELRDIAMIAERCLRHDALNKMATLTKDEYSPACHCGLNPGGLCGQCWLEEKPCS